MCNCAEVCLHILCAYQLLGQLFHWPFKWNFTSVYYGHRRTEENALNGEVTILANIVLYYC